MPAAKPAVPQIWVTLGKWVIAPLALAGAGYFIVGPRLARLGPSPRQEHPTAPAPIRKEAQAHPGALAVVAPSHRLRLGSPPPESSAAVPASNAPMSSPVGTPVSTPSRSTTALGKPDDALGPDDSLPNPRSLRSDRGPEVSVSVRAATPDDPATVTKTTHPKRKKKHRKHRAVKVRKPAANPATDDGSFGGTQDSTPEKNP